MNHEHDQDDDLIDLIDLGAVSIETLGGIGGSLELSQVGILPGITND